MHFVSLLRNHSRAHGHKDILYIFCGFAFYTKNLKLLLIWFHHCALALQVIGLVPILESSTLSQGSAVFTRSWIKLCCPIGLLSTPLSMLYQYLALAWFQFVLPFQEWLGCSWLFAFPRQSWNWCVVFHKTRARQNQYWKWGRLRISEWTVKIETLKNYSKTKPNELEI